MNALTFSDYLGYTSILCWLGAQFPQVIENYKRQSVEGLALPFLLNWFLGDFTNLIGCILTHQLPFQTYLAAYFVFVDFNLIGQYAYYSRKAPTVHYLRARSVSFAGRITSDERHPHYRTISTVAANVAATAALAAQHEANSPRAQRGRRLAPSTDEIHEVLRRSPSELTDSEEIDEEALARLADSFRSEGGYTRKKHVSWSKERSRRAGSLGPNRGYSSASLRQVRPPLPMTPADESLDRGRSLERTSSDQGWRGSSDGSSRVDRGSTSRASRRGASMVFLSVWALFGVGTLVGSRHGLPQDNLLPGRVLSSTDSSAPVIPYEWIPIAHVGTLVSENPAIVVAEIATPIEPTPPPHHEDPSWERIIGRVFAWTCTTLYLTSRLPQIWKNFARKSVEGLSMYLFVSAFLGNLFYVASLLTSPKARLPGAADYIKESIPYMLGSGGTLMFDVTIVTQSFLYRPHSGKRGRRDSIRSSRGVAPEEEALLSADEPTSAHRRRSVSDPMRSDARR